jgi:hypothetical protein
VPKLEVELVSQRYCTVSTLDDEQRAVIGFSTGAFEAGLTMDADGMVVDYPGLATRLESVNPTTT